MLTFLCRALRAERHELPALAWSFAYFFTLLAGYYVLRPVRDEMGVQAGTAQLPWLFTATFVTMLALVPLYGWLCARLPRARLLPAVYGFFAANLVVFWAALESGVPAKALAPAFFVWVSVFNLFVVSVFWALIVDTFNSEQGKRLFGFIAAGATIGAITGSSITATFARHVPTPLLLAGAIILLEVGVFSVRHLSRLSEALNARPNEALGSPVGGNVLAGITHPFKSAYLANVSLFILLFAITATFLYFQQAGLVRDNFHDRGAQTAFFAQIDLAVNVITLIVQLFFTGRIVGILGVSLTLAILPALTLLGFGALAALPAVSTLVVFQVLRRSSDYAIARPTREVLYTVVPREDRYKAKSFIDTVVYRGGDQIGAWAYALIAMTGFGSTLMAAIAIGLAALWLLNGLWLGRRQALLARQEG